MENNNNQKEDQDDSNSSLNEQNIDQNSWQKSYINDQIPEDITSKESEEEYTDGPSSKLPQRISDVPNGDKNNSEIAAEKEIIDEEPKQDRITSIRPYLGNGPF